MQAQREKGNTSTLKTTRTQGQVAALLAEAMLANSGNDMRTHVLLCQVDMITEKSDVFEEGDTPCVDEANCKVGTAEVLKVVIKAHFYMYGKDWNNAITGAVQAKLRLFRESRSSPWKLHYVMFIEPGLHNGRVPEMHVVREFRDGEQLKAILDDPGKFYDEYADGKAIDRSGNSLHLLRLSQLILNDRVVPWEVLHPVVPDEPKKEVKKSGFRKFFRKE
jgi:hypothetical protein